MKDHDIDRNVTMPQPTDYDWLNGSKHVKRETMFEPTRYEEIYTVGAVSKRQVWSKPERWGELLMAFGAGGVVACLIIAAFSYVQ